MRKVLKFSATWCGPCKMMAKIFDEIETSIEVQNVDVDENSELTKKYNIRGVPTLVMVDDDIEIKRRVGVADASEIKNWLEN